MNYRKKRGMNVVNFTNLIFLLFFAVWVESCWHNEVVPQWSESINSDSTFIERNAIEFLDSAVLVGNELRLHPLSHYKGDVLRVRNQSGWGSFDVIATIYRELDCNVQIIKQINSRDPRGFEVNEFKMESLKCDSIFERIFSPSFMSIPFDLEPNIRIIDGDIYSIAGRNKSSKHVVTWQVMDDDRLEYIPEQLKKDRLFVRKFYHDIFYVTNRSAPCINFYVDYLGLDSIIFLSYVAKEYDYIKEVTYSCENCIINYSDIGLDTIKIMRIDTLKDFYDYTPNVMVETMFGKRINSNCVTIEENNNYWTEF